MSTKEFVKQFSKITISFAIALLMLAALAGCQLPAVRNQPLKLEVVRTEFPSKLNAVFYNQSTSEVQIWKENNSWGMWAIAVEVKSPKTGKTYKIVRTQNIQFTLNAPLFYTIPPNGTQVIKLDLNDGYWEFPKALKLSSEMKVRLLYKVDRSKESNSVNPVTGELTHVFTGELHSGWK